MKEKKRREKGGYMKTLTLTLAVAYVLSVPVLVFGLNSEEYCKSLKKGAAEDIQRLRIAYEANILGVEDPLELGALRNSFNEQVDLIEMERDANLSIHGCLSGDGDLVTDPVPGPVDEPVVDNPGDGGTGDNPVDEPVVDNPGDGGTGDNPVDEPVVDNPGDGGTGDNPGDEPVVDDPGNDDDPTLAFDCHDHLKAYAQQLKDQKKAPKQIFHAVRAEAHKMGCNFGQYRASTRVPDHLKGKHRSKRLGHSRNRR
ncbi:hypothetical protein BVX98_06680 [bacterium F11]|nr:hypothetical protein BVX98_06680 [bacterium F11]